MLPQVWSISMTPAWVSVREVPPAIGQDVVYFCQRSGPWVGKYLGKTKSGHSFSCFAEFNDGGTVTHWFPLPSKPVRQAGGDRKSRRGVLTSV